MKELQELLEQSRDKVLIIDVRTVEEYAEMHVPEAINIPLSDLVSKSMEIPTDKIIITTCYKGGNRSAQGVEILHQLGYTKAKKLCGGTCAWLDIEPNNH